LLASIHTALPLSLAAAHSRQFLSPLPRPSPPELLTFIDNKVDRVSGMIAFKATFPNEDETLWPGQFVDVTVKLADEPDVLVVPTTAVMEGQQGAQVFVVTGKTADLRKIKTGRTVGDLTIVTEGLNAGELVVTSGQFRISPGGKVTIAEARRPDVAENVASPE
jgi:multidrug efflux system membrane fusion protein